MQRRCAALQNFGKILMLFLRTCSFGLQLFILVRLCLDRKVKHTLQDFQDQNQSENISTGWKPLSISTFLSTSEMKTWQSFGLGFFLWLFFFFFLQERVLQKQHTLVCGGIGGD